MDDDSKLATAADRLEAKVVSIQPPSGFGKEIWEELADKGYLKRDASGFTSWWPGSDGLLCQDTCHPTGSQRGLSPRFDEFRPYCFGSNVRR